MEKKDNSNSKIVILIISIIVFIAIIILLLLKGCEKSYTISFDTDGGTFIKDIEFKKSDYLEEPIEPTKEGYKFIGWYYNGELFDFNTKIKEDIKLVAKWEKLGITLKEKEISMIKDTERQIDIELNDEIKKEDLVYESSDEEIVTVSETGKIKAIKEGKAIITISTKDNKYSEKLEITVTGEEVLVKSIYITGSKEVLVGNTIKLTANIGPIDATNKKVIWTSSNGSVAIVDELGNVRGIKAGTVTITATTEDGNNTATYDITIRENNTTRPAYTPSTQTTNTTTTTTTKKTTAKTTTTTKKKTTTTTTKKQETYILHLTAIKVEGTTDIYQYKFSITKNGKSFTDYSGFEINGHKYRKVTSNPTVAGNDVTKNNKATITLTNGEEKTLVVEVK